jgi:hypothetical protein
MIAIPMQPAAIEISIACRRPPLVARELPLVAPHPTPEPQRRICIANGRISSIPKETRMNLGSILLSLVALAIVLALIHVMTKMDSERESATRRKRIRVHPLSGDTVTHLGRS